MSHLIKTILITALLAVFAANGAFAARAYLPNNFHTPSTPLVLESLPVSGVRVAGVYWLPDYLDKNLDFTDRSQSVNCTNPGASDYNPTHPACKKVDERECKTLGYEIPSFVSDWSKYDYTEFLAANKVRCYKNFTCKSSYSKSSCNQWYQFAGGSCTDNRGTFYERCDPKPCPASYTAGISSCSPADGYNYVSNGYSGTQICGRCDVKACPQGYSTSVTSCGTGYSFATNGMSGSSNCGICNQRPCSDNGWYDSNPNSGVYRCSSVTWGGKTCQSCYQPQCSEGGYEAAAKGSGYICNSVGYYGRTCYNCAVDPCSQVTAVSVPANATCSGGYATCSSKCAGWSCNPGYSKSGSSCIENKPSCSKKDYCSSGSTAGCSSGIQEFDDGCGGKCKVCVMGWCNDMGYMPVGWIYEPQYCSNWEYCPLSSSYRMCR